MEKLNRDNLFSLSVNLDLPDLLRFCSSSRRFNNEVCKNKDIWFYKLKEFPDYHLLNANLSPKDTYILFNLTKLKEKLGLKQTIYEIYDLKKLNLSFRRIKEIPKEISILSNLSYLDLGSNKIEIIPKEIGLLSNLTELYLNGNKINTVPKQIGNLTNLKILLLSDNKLNTVPKQIGKLSKLKYLNLFGNEIKTIPEEIRNKLPNTKIFF